MEQAQPTGAKPPSRHTTIPGAPSMGMSHRRSPLPPLLVGVAGIVLAATWYVTDRPDEPSAPTSNAAPTAAAAGALDEVALVEARADVAGYDRDCSSGGGCVFGPAWSDDVEVDGGHNGCDTRNDILARDLEATTFKPGTNDCVVLTGQLVDPYTGQTVTFERGQGTSELVQIDHVIPLAAAWDHGASTWTPEQRRDFANDPRNLRATQGAVNASKGDSTPQEWMPEHDTCSYATTYTDVAVGYGLTVSAGDAEALALALESC